MVYMQGYGVSDDSIPLCPGPGPPGICFCHRGRHFQVSHVALSLCTLDVSKEHPASLVHAMFDLQ